MARVLVRHVLAGNHDRGVSGKQLLLRPRPSVAAHQAAGVNSPQCRGRTARHRPDRTCGCTHAEGKRVGLQRADAGAEVAMHELHDRPLVERAPLDLAATPCCSRSRRRVPMRAIRRSASMSGAPRRPRTVDAADAGRAAAPADEQQADRVSSARSAGMTDGQITFNSPSACSASCATTIFIAGGRR